MGKNIVGIRGKGVATTLLDYLKLVADGLLQERIRVRTPKPAPFLTEIEIEGK